MYSTRSLGWANRLVSTTALYNAILRRRSDLIPLLYQDFDEPERKRHLVRLWLTAHDEWADGDAFVRQGIPIKQGVAAEADEIAQADDRTNH